MVVMGITQTLFRENVCLSYVIYIPDTSLARNRFIIEH